MNVANAWHVRQLKDHRQRKPRHRQHRPIADAQAEGLTRRGTPKSRAKSASVPMTIDSAPRFEAPALLLLAI
jgi:hypothetical protein